MQKIKFILICFLLIAICASKNSLKNQSSAKAKFLPQQQVTAQLQCGFGQQIDGYYLGGCLEKCRKFTFLNDAAAACCNNPRCGGITFSSFVLGQGNTGKNLGFQLRSQSKLTPNPAGSGESSWQMTSRSNLETQLIQGFTTNGQRCTFSQRFDDTFLESCMFDCRPFATLQEAAVACAQNSQCGGITWSSFVLGKGNQMENFGYQLRFGKRPMPKNDSEEISWVFNGCTSIPLPPPPPPPKKECPIIYPECGFKGQGIEICDGNVQIPKATYKSIYIPPGFRFTINTTLNGVQTSSKTYSQSNSCDNIDLLVQTSSYKVHKHQKNEQSEN